MRSNARRAALRILGSGLVLVAAFGNATGPAWSQAPSKAVSSKAAVSSEDVSNRTQGQGPFKRVVLRNVTIIDGTGAPAQGPFDIVLSGDRIAEIRSIGAPGAIDESDRPAAGELDLDLTGKYVLPGFVDTHVHLHSLSDPQHVPSDYVLKLWLLHGVTTVRDVGSGHPIEWLKTIQRLSATNAIVAPRIQIFPFFQDIGEGMPTTPELARAAIRDAKRRGADGVKFLGAPGEVLLAALDEAERIGLRTAMHHAQTSVAEANVLVTSAHGLDTMEHWYGLPEAMLLDGTIQSWPTNYNNSDEAMRFGEAGRLWLQSAQPGTDAWNKVRDTLLDRKLVISPTMTAYLASRDFMRMSRATWHDEYTLPALWDYYRPSRKNHGSYWFDWTSENEMAWRSNYRRWMEFLNDYKNHGGVVTVGSDSGFIYNLYGFGYVQELELLREAGFSPLEVFKAATSDGAKALGLQNEIGAIRVGRKADLVVVDGNPLANLKLLYGTGTVMLDDKTGKVVRRTGIKFVIKDGIIFDTELLRKDIKDQVALEKRRRNLPEGSMKIEAE